jgi:4-nitrophenyl phosphatase
MPWALDLDGVVWLDDDPIPGSAEAIARLRAAGEEVLFVTNLSSRPVAEAEAKLARHGIPAEGAVVTSAMAAATLVEPGERVHLCAGPGVEAELVARGCEVVQDGPADAVVVGLHTGFDYDALRRASAAVRGGARLIGTNDDPTFPTPEGLLPGGGSILAAVAVASGGSPTVAGKPYPPMAQLVRDRRGPEGVVVGDRADTDGALAALLGYRFALVLTGASGDTGDHEPRPDLVAADLRAVVDAWLEP